MRAALHAIWLVTFLILYAFLSAVNSGPPDRVRFLRPPRILTDQESTRWIVQVDQHAEHRLLVVAAYADGIVVRRSDEDLPGEKARRTRWLDWGPLPAGELQITAVVFNSEREVARATVPITVHQMRP